MGGGRGAGAQIMRGIRSTTRGAGNRIARQIANRMAAGVTRGAQSVPGTGGTRRRAINVRNRAGQTVYRI